MKTLNFLLMIGCVVLLASCGASKKNSNTVTLEDNRARKTELLKEMKTKASKEAKKEADQYKKEGYKIFLGDLPMEKQVENAWVHAVDINDLGYPKYIVGNAQVTAGNVTAAKSQALHAAKVEIASLTSSMVASLIESSVANNEVTTGEAQTLNKYLQATKELVTADFGQVQKDIEIYRELPNKSVQEIMRVSYNSDLALQAAKRRMQEGMVNETQALHQKLDKIFNLERLQPESNTNVKMSN